MAPYHHSYTFDAVGNRKTETQHAVGNSPLLEREYSYPAAGQRQPHTLTQVKEKTPAGDRLNTYEYDKAGNTIRRNRVGEDQKLTWDAEGNLESVTEAGKTTSYLYDVDGTRMLRREPDATTLYLPGMEVRLDHKTRATEGTHYHALPGGSTVVRKVDGYYYIAADHHGTGQAMVDEAGGIQHRRSTPFGEPRGEQPEPGRWPTEKGFVNGNQDSTTDLVNIGAREYDLMAGRFISIDPVIDVNDPQQMNGYAYGNNNPVSFSDPDGLKSCSDDRCGPGADFVDKDGNYIEVPGHNDGCNGCSGSFDPDVPTINNPRTGGRGGGGEDAAERARKDALEKAKQIILEAAKALAQVAMDELGITDALACFTKGDIGGCVETAINVATSFVGGMVAKFARKYGAPWNWEKGWQLGKTVKGILGKLVDGVKKFFKCRNSFVPGTLVLMADGSRKKIEDVDVGEVVVATDPQTGETVAKAVVATIIGQGAKNLVEITVDTDAASGSATGLLVATDGHPFWVADLGQWVPATELEAGQMLRTSSGTWVQVTSVRRWTQQARVYNFTIADIHTYHVLAGTTPILVHNCDPLSDYADAVRNGPGVKFASEYTSPSGKPYYGHNRHGLEAEGPLADALDEVDHHGGCAEVHCLIQAQKAEGPAAIRGGDMRTVRTRNNSMPTSNTEGHGAVARPCARCGRLLEYLDIG